MTTSTKLLSPAPTVPTTGSGSVAADSQQPSAAPAVTKHPHAVRRSIPFQLHHDFSYHAYAMGETPHISHLDVEAEVLVIHNPRDTDLPLRGYFLLDSHKAHEFHFPEDTIVPALGELNVYTCPASNHQDSFQHPCVLWRNSDGSLRKKEVLNNDHCTMNLHDPHGKCIASYTAGKSAAESIIRRAEETVIYNLLLPEQLRIIISVIRIVLILSMALCTLKRKFMFVPCYWMALGCDLLTRGDRFHPDPIHITSLQTFGDKLNVLVLYVVLANELLHYEGLSAALASFGHVSQAALRTFGLPIFFALTALEFTVLNLSDIRLNERDNYIDRKSWVYNYFVHCFGEATQTVLALSSEVFLVMLFNVFQGLDLDHAPNTIPFQSLRTLYQVAFYLGAVSFALRQLNNLSILLAGLTNLSADDVTAIAE